MTLEELEELKSKADKLRAQLLDLALEQNGRSKKGRTAAMGMLDSRRLIDDLTLALWEQANEAVLLRVAYMSARSETHPLVH